MKSVFYKPIKRKVLALAIAAFTFLGTHSSMADVAMAYYCTFVLKNDGTLWVVGSNDYGIFGNSQPVGSLQKTLTRATSFSDIVQIDANSNHALFLRKDGTVWGMGENSNFQLGNGKADWGGSLVKVPDLINITQISTAPKFSLFLKNDGTVWACGNNDRGQLGDGTNISRPKPVQIPNLKNITQISAGDGHSVFLKNDGTVWICGNNNRGQLGDGTYVNRSTPVALPNLTGIVQISAGSLFTLFLKNDGTVWACGSNSIGELGDGTYTDRSTPVKVPSLSGITRIEAGDIHSVFLKNDGTAWATGFNESGQLGDGTYTSRNIPVRVKNLTGAVKVHVSLMSSSFETSTGLVCCVGDNWLGQLGKGNTLTKSNTIVSVIGGDTQKPVFTSVPTSRYAEATSANGATVNYPGAIATDNLTVTTLTYSKASGTVFPMGTTAVTVTASDIYGATNSASFNVTVGDKTAPILQVPANITTRATSAQGAVVSYPAATATDLVTARPTITYSKASGTVFPIGITTVAVTARDAAGNVSTRTFAVTVNR